MYWRPSFVILDEATSAMDPETERRLILQLMSMDIRILWVAHALPDFVQPTMTIDFNKLSE
jgi:ABC-type uncharacterized transport system fused permease/ATPase subunit